MNSGRLPSEVLAKLYHAAKGAVFIARKLDPRIVRIRDPRRYSPKFIALLALGSALVIGAVSFAATSRDSSEESVDRPDEIHAMTVKRSGVETYEPPIEKRPSIRQASEKKPPRFYNPVYVFSDDATEGASAYPLADPPGIVVDLKGAAEPEEQASKYVGDDDRIRSVRRRVTPDGLRYIIGLSIPVRRIEVIHEGGVVMVFPVS